MKICLVSLDYKPYRSSGLTTYAENLAKGLTESGHNVTVFAAQRSDLPAYHWVESVELYRVPIDYLDWITYSPRASKLLEQLERQRVFDIVHFLDIHFAYAYAGPFVASVWQSFRQRMTADGGRPYNTGFVDMWRRQIYYRVAKRYMEKPSLARAGRLIASCQSTRDEFTLHYNISVEKIDMAIQGIDTHHFSPKPVEKLRQELGVKDYRILLFVGFITPRKGLKYLAQAMQKLSSNNHLIIVGRWAPGCRRQFFRDLGSAAQRVHEIGFVCDEELPYYYSLADVYVSPSFLEGLGITPIEALACGTPAVVTSATSGPEEIGNAGIVVPPRDAKSMANAILRLLDDSDLRYRLGQQGRQRASQNFSYQRMTSLTLQSYNRFLQEKEYIYS